MSKNSSKPSNTNTKNQQVLDNLLGKSVISIKEARKLLGAEYQDKSDEWVMQTVCSMRNVAEILIKAMGGSTKCKGGV